ncbi:MAG: cupin domain-containing protein [Bdellovibrionaceae bacterium]|nr:cupin domain-containing protein [Pseudobdellovibrionaceae bacterium]
MLITRWQAPLTPTKSQIQMILANEDLDPYEETYEPTRKVKDHRSPFCEIRVVVSGEMLFNISGTQFLLRTGDRVEIPANTKHSHHVQGDAPCVCICAQRAI